MTRRMTQEQINAEAREHATAPQRDTLDKMREIGWNVYALNTHKTAAGVALVACVSMKGSSAAIMPDGSVRRATRGKRRIEWSWSACEGMLNALR